MAVMIYHNPNCSTSRKALALIRESGEEPRIVEYLKDPPSPDELASLIQRMGFTARDVLRRKEKLCGELGLDDSSLTEEALIDMMVAHPILIERPIVITPLGVKLCRPAETVLAILPDLPRDAPSSS